MANLHLVTGYAGTEHVTSADQGAFHALTMGSGQCVIKTGNQFAAHILTNNLVKVLDGEIYMHGRYIRLEPNAYAELAIESGEQGKKRHDLIVARYTKGLVSGVEEANLVVIKGTPSETTPSDPEYTTGNILVGDTQNDIPLHRVTIDGLTATGIETLFTAVDFDIDTKFNAMNNKKQNCTDSLPEEKNIADVDHIPFFDVSASAHRKMPWSAVKEAFKSTDHLSNGVLPPERGGTGYDNLEALAIALGNVRIISGSYTGDGTYGITNKNSLTFPFTPKVVFLGSTDNGLYAPTNYVWGADSFLLVGGGAASTPTVHANHVTVSGNTMSWYAGGAAWCQLNNNNAVYYYVAIG